MEFVVDRHNFSCSALAHRRQHAACRSRGTTERTLYNHFPSKDYLLAAALEHQHALALERFDRRGDSLVETPGEVIEQIFVALAQWAMKPRWAGAGFTRLALELADL